MWLPPRMPFLTFEKAFALLGIETVELFPKFRFRLLFRVYTLVIVLLLFANAFQMAFGGALAAFSKSLTKNEKTHANWDLGWLVKDSMLLIGYVVVHFNRKFLHPFRLETSRLVISSDYAKDVNIKPNSAVRKRIKKAEKVALILIVIKTAASITIYAVLDAFAIDKPFRFSCEYIPYQFLVDGFAYLSLAYFTLVNYSFYLIINNLVTQASDSTIHVELKTTNRVREAKEAFIALMKTRSQFNAAFAFVPFMWVTVCFANTCVRVILIAAFDIYWDALHVFDVGGDWLSFAVYLAVMLRFLASSCNFDKFRSDFLTLANGDNLSCHEQFTIAMDWQMVLLHSKSDIRPFGLFSVGNGFILVFANAAVTFSVMCIQLFEKK